MVLLSDHPRTSARPRVTVLMLAFNRPDFMDRAISSVMGQDFCDWELIVVHDGINHRIESLMKRWIERDSRVRYFHREKSGNIADAYNFGITHARGDYIAILDDDDYWAVTDKLAKQVIFLDGHPDYVGCGGGMIVVDRDGNELMKCLKREMHGEIRRLALLANPMAHSTCMFRREIGGAVTRYDETLSGFQDWDLWLKLANRGKLYNFQESFTFYTLWQGGGSYQQQRANAKSAVKIIWRHHGTYEKGFIAFLLACLHFAYACFPSFIKRRSFRFLSLLKKTLFASKRTDSLTPVGSSPIAGGER